MTRPPDEFLYKVADDTTPFLTFIFLEGSALALPWIHMASINSRPPRLTFVFARAQIVVELASPIAPRTNVYWQIEQAAQLGRLLWLRETPGALTFVSAVESSPLTHPNHYIR